MNLREAYEAIANTLSGRDSEELMKYAEDPKAYVNRTRGHIQENNLRTANEEYARHIKHRAVE